MCDQEIGDPRPETRRERLDQALLTPQIMSRQFTWLSRFHLSLSGFEDVKD
jgi:hypothetical protein